MVEEVGVATLPQAPPIGWSIACDSAEEWEELTESLASSKHQETRRLYRTLTDLLPDILYFYQVRTPPPPSPLPP